MVTAFLIATLIVFSINLIINVLFLAALAVNKQKIPIILPIYVLSALVMITLNIFALIEN